jgi:hypothetical protein
MNVIAAKETEVVRPPAGPRPPFENWAFSGGPDGGGEPTPPSRLASAVPSAPSPVPAFRQPGAS